MCPRSLNSDARFNGSAGVVRRALMAVDLGTLRWQNESVALPSDLADTHYGATLVGRRHLFIVTGQVGWWGSCGEWTADHWQSAN